MLRRYRYELSPGLRRPVAGAARRCLPKSMRYGARLIVPSRKVIELSANWAGSAARQRYEAAPKEPHRIEVLVTHDSPGEAQPEPSPEWRTARHTFWLNVQRQRPPRRTDQPAMAHLFKADERSLSAHILSSLRRQDVPGDAGAPLASTRTSDGRISMSDHPCGLLQSAWRDALHGLELYLQTL